MIRRLERPLVWCCLVVCAAALLVRLVPYHGPALSMNLTASMPRGIYASDANAAAHVGDDVAVCLPPAGVAFALHKHLELEIDADSPCYRHTIPLNKLVIAVPGDRVAVTDAGVIVNGHLVSNSRPIKRLYDGTPLPRPSPTVVPAGSVWTWTPAARSYDSRYWGPMTLLARIHPVLTFGTSE